MYLYAEHGYEETTVADIAARAGLTKRTFFRHFTDKREVLFAGADAFQRTFVSAVGEAPDTAAPMDAITAGLDAIAQMLDQDRGREFAALRQRIIAATPELQERELIKLAQVASAAAGALQARGVPPLQAQIAAEAGVTIIKLAFPRWVADGKTLPLAEVMRACERELRGVMAG